MLRLISDYSLKALSRETIIWMFLLSIGVNSASTQRLDSSNMRQIASGLIPGLTFEIIPQVTAVENPAVAGVDIAHDL